VDKHNRDKVGHTRLNIACRNIRIATIDRPGELAVRDNELLADVREAYQSTAVFEHTVIEFETVHVAPE
jgi:hypothetical protein